MKRKFAIVIVIAIGVVLLSATLIHGRAPSSTRAVSTAAPTPRVALIGGPGKVEPSSENIQLGSELSGKLKSVNVEEGDAIHRGQVLAELENDDCKAQVAAAEADVLAKQAALRKVINGARPQERREALSSMREADAVMANARAEMDRHQKLFDAGVVSRQEAETFFREYSVAKARYQVAVERHSLIDSGAREEDRALAEANLKLAQAHLEEARSRCAKTLISSPIDGTVLRKHHRNGESVSNSAIISDPVVTIGDKRRLRVRIEVDETEVSRVRIGQRAFVTADAFAGQKFWGYVIRVGEQLGRKDIRTDQPSEHVDTKVLESIVELDPGQQLPVGLRVDSFIVTEGPEVTRKE